MTFLIDEFGVSAVGNTTTLATTADTGFTYTATTNDLQQVIASRNVINLPLFNR